MKVHPIILVFLFVFALQARAEDCVHSAPLDGYQFSPAAGTTVQPTQDQVNQTMQAIYAHIQEERNTPANISRNDGESYCLFHPAGTAITGTVLFFHGFSNRPKEMALLASYLFNSGFNVYNPYLSKQYMVPGNTYWPKLLYNFSPNLNQADPNNDIKRILTAYATGPGSPDFANVFKMQNPAPNQNFDAWIVDAKRRLHELDAMPGPVFLVGLSLGSAIALRLGSEEGNGRIKGIVAHSPYLADHDPNKENQIKVIGPLDTTTNVLQDIDFSVNISVASVAAQYLVSGGIYQTANLNNLASIPTFLVGTESDISADTGKSYALHSQLVQISGNGIAHQWFTYPQGDAVGHAMTNPCDYRRTQESNPPFGGSRNYRYRSLYQEAYDFFVNQKVDDNNLNGYGQRSDLPAVLFDQVNCPVN